MHWFKKGYFFLDSLMVKGCILIIHLYQKFFSPDHSFWAKEQPPYCKFFPTCSRYMIDALEEHGTIKGGFLGIKRICRCHPWSKGGHDPVEKIHPPEEHFH